MEDLPEPRFPLAELAVPEQARPVDGTAAVTLAERRPGAIVEFACWPDARAAFAEQVLPVLRLAELPPVGRFATAPDVMALGLAPGRYQAIARNDGLSAALEAALPPATGTTVDLSHARAGLRIAGPAAQLLLQKGLAFDLSESAFPPGAVAQSAIHHIGVTVARLDPESFDVFAFRGFAVSLWTWAADAAEEFGWAGAAPVS